MIFIVVKFTVRPGRGDAWPELVREFTRATRAEPGNLFFEWSRSLDNPDEFVLVEAFESPEAGAEHVSSAHFTSAMCWMPYEIAETPKIVHVEADQPGWNAMAELAPAGAGNP